MEHPGAATGSEQDHPKWPRKNTRCCRTESHKECRQPSGKDHPGGSEAGCGQERPGKRRRCRHTHDWIVRGRPQSEKQEQHEDARMKHPGRRAKEKEEPSEVSLDWII